METDPSDSIVDNADKTDEPTMTSTSRKRKVSLTSKGPQPNKIARMNENQLTNQEGLVSGTPKGL